MKNSTQQICYWNLPPKFKFFFVKIVQKYGDILLLDLASRRLRDKYRNSHLANFREKLYTAIFFYWNLPPKFKFLVKIVQKYGDILLLDLASRRLEDKYKNSHLAIFREKLYTANFFTEICLPNLSFLLKIVQKYGAILLLDLASRRLGDKYKNSPLANFHEKIYTANFFTEICTPNLRFFFLVKIAQK